MDAIAKALAFDGQIAVAALRTTDLTAAAREIHHLSDLATAALGRTLTAAAFMASELKSEGDRLSVTIRGDGAGGEIVVAGSAALEMRGYVGNPGVELPLNAAGKLDVAGFVGRTGRMTVVRSMGLKKPYVGSAALVSGEIAEDFAAYYAFSEQQPAALALGVSVTGRGVKGAGGVVIRPMPGADEAAIRAAEAVVPRLGGISAYFAEHTAEEALAEFFGEKPLEVRTPVYRCLCSREYAESLLLALGKEECEDILRERGKAEIGCSFCNRRYEFGGAEIEALFRKGRGHE